MFNQVIQIMQSLPDMNLLAQFLQVRCPSTLLNQKY